MDDSSKQQMDPEVGELQVTCEKSTILHMASRLGNEERTEQILGSHPSLVHQINMKGDTPLHIAARAGHLGVAKLLIDRAKTEVVESGMPPLRMVNKKKLTVLQEAVRNDHYSVVDLLIEEDPGLTCTTIDGVESPLFMAVEGRFYQIADRILETFPNCALSGRRGMTIMHAAVIGLPNDDTVLNPLSVFFNTCWATFNRCIKGKKGLSLQFVVKVLEKIGHTILEEKDEFGWIPLHYAAYIGNKEVVKLFLEKNSSLAYIKNKQGMSALHISAQEGCIGVIEILMEKCPDVCELLDYKDQTALHVAARNGNLDVLRTLLRMTCFEDLINEPDKEGNTLLHEAARHPNPGILRMLANDRRINKTAINKLGMTAGDIVRSSEQLCRHKKKFPKSLERRVLEETRMEQLNGEKENETSENTALKVPAQDDKAAGLAKDTSMTTGYLTKQDHNYKSKEAIENIARVNLLVATIIASITFAAFVSMPGGYDNENGMPILREMLPFRHFLIANSLAFGMATSSMFIHFVFPLFSRLGFGYPLLLVEILTELSILSSLVAFYKITDAVLTGKKKITDSNIPSPLPSRVAFYCFAISIFLWFLYSGIELILFRLDLRSVFLSIVEKFRMKEKKSKSRRVT